MVSKNYGYKRFVRGYGFDIIAGGTWTVLEKLGLLRSYLRSLVKSAVWLRSGLRFQVKSAGRLQSGLHSTSFFPNCDIISHTFNFRHAMHSPLRTNSSVFLHSSSPSPQLLPGGRFSGFKIGSSVNSCRRVSWCGFRGMIKNGGGGGCYALPR